jgi:hypothetical protein
MAHEALINGGHLVRLESGSLAVEGVPGACRGLVVQSATSHLDGTDRVSGQYSLTRRVTAGVDLWHVRRESARKEAT